MQSIRKWDAGRLAVTAYPIVWGNLTVNWRSHSISASWALEAPNFHSSMAAGAIFGKPFTSQHVIAGSRQITRSLHTWRLKRRSHADSSQSTCGTGNSIPIWAGSWIKPCGETSFNKCPNTNWLTASLSRRPSQPPFNVSLANETSALCIHLSNNDCKESPFSDWLLTVP